MKKLSLKHKRFVAEYLKDQNASQAAIRSGYGKKNADVVGPRLLGYVGIKTAIEEKLKKVEAKCEITAEWILKSLKEVAERCMQAVPYRVGGIEIRGIFTFDASGANRALELLGKHLAMFTEKADITLRQPESIQFVPAAKKKNEGSRGL